MHFPHVSLSFSAWNRLTTSATALLAVYVALRPLCPRWREARLLHVLEIELMGDLGVETAEFVIVIALMLALKSFAILRVKRVEAPLPRQE